MMLSLLAWPLVASIFHSAYYGGGFLRSTMGLAPLIVVTSVPAIVLVVAGVWLSPSKGRKVAFVFFALALLSSGGGMEMITFQQAGALGFWLTAFAGVVLGSLAGLLLSLRLQRLRKREPNQAPEPTPTAVTPPARQEARQP